jgi:Tfp pilus assembly protein PilF
MQLSAFKLKRPGAICAWQAIVLVLATNAVYSAAIGNGFVWDDKLHLIDNVVLQENGLFRVWLTTDYINYWPLTSTSYWLEHQLWGLEPAGYHVTNIVLHTVSSLLIWRILLQLKIPAAWVAALLFAVHPVNVESVAWIAQRKNVLCLVFYLCALYSYLRFDENGRRGMYLLAVVCFLLAMLSKGAAVALPVVVLLCLFWRRRLCARDLIDSLPFFIVAGVMSLVEIWFQYTNAIGDDFVRDDSFLARLTGAGWVIWFYIDKAFMPLDLTFVYPRWKIDPADALAHIPNLMLIVLLAIAWRYRHRWGRPVLFALAYFIVTLAPVLGFINIYFMKFSFVADHYQYLSIIAPIALVSGAGWTYFAQSSRRNRLAACGAATLLVLMLGMASWRQTHFYKDRETLWHDTIRKNPQCWLAYYNLGNLVSEQGRFDVAEAHYRQALRINADDAWAHHNLAIVLEKQGRLDEAARSFQQALQHDPRLAVVQYNLGCLRVRQQRLVQAVQHFRAALQIEPKMAKAHNNLGAVLQSQGQADEAAGHYRRALQIDPKNVHTHLNLGRLLIQQGRRVQGETHLREANRLKSELPSQGTGF